MTTLDTDNFLRLLGEELRETRKSRGLTVDKLRDTLQFEISSKTLGSYEQATRHCTVARLVELCMALDEPAHELLKRVCNQLPDTPMGPVIIDLHAILRTRLPELAPFRRWAQDRVDNHADVVTLDKEVLDEMATVCGLDGELFLRKIKTALISNTQ